MKPVEQMTEAELRDHVTKFRRLLNPVWMQMAYVALGENPRPKPDAAVFTFSGGGGSDWTTFADFVEVMGDPWAVDFEGPPHDDSEEVDPVDLADLDFLDEGPLPEGYVEQ